VSVGVGAKNRGWLQIRADIFIPKLQILLLSRDRRLVLQIIAAVEIGWYKDFNSCADKFIAFRDTFYPDKKRVGKYEKIYELYKQVYLPTKNICKIKYKSIVKTNNVLSIKYINAQQ
jgi:xylulokinase